MGKQSQSSSGQPADFGHLTPSVTRLLTAADIAYFHLTTEGLIADTGCCLADWLGIDPDSLTGRRFTDLLAVGSRKPFEELLVLLKAEPSATGVRLDLQNTRQDLIPITLSATLETESAASGIECLAVRQSAEQLSSDLVRSDFLARAMDLSPDPVAVCRKDKGIVIAVNDAYTRKFGRRREELVGSRVDDLGVWINQDERDEYLRLTSEYNRVDNLQISHPTGDGGVLKCLMSARVIEIGDQTYILTVIREASEIIDTRDALLESEERFRAIADYTYDMESWFGVDGKLLWVNNAVERIVGYSREECYTMDNPPLSFVHEEDRARVTSAFRGALNGTTGNDLEYRIIRKDGSVVWVATSWQPIIGADGNVMGHRASTRDISKRKSAEAALRQSEEKYRQLVQRSLQAIVVLQGSPLRPVFVNPAAEAMIGYTLSDLAAMTSEELAGIVHPDDRWVLDRLQARLQGEDVPDHYVYRSVKKSGEVIWVEVLATSIRYGQEPAVQFAAMDITKRKKSEDELRRRDRVLKAVSGIAQRLLRVTSVDAVLQDCVETLGHAAGVSRCYIFQNSIGPNGKRLCTQRFEWVAEGIQSFLSDPAMIDLPYSRLGTMESIMAGGDVYYGLVSELSPDERTIMESQDILSLALVPIFSRDEFWGFLGFDECTEERVWSSAELDALRAAAGTIGAAVDRDKISADLRSSENRWRSFVSQMPGYILEADCDGIVRYVNAVPAVFKVEEIVGKSLADLGTNESRRIVLDAQRAVVERGELVTVEVPGMDQVDSAWYSIRMGPLKDGDRINGIICIALDITERRQMERALTASEARYRRVAEEQTEFIVRWLPDGTRTYANESYCRRFGLARDEVIGSNILTAIPPEHADKILANIRSLTPDHPAMTDEHEVVFPDGSGGWQQWTDRALFDERGQITEIQSVGRDVTDLRRAEEALRESEERFRLAFQTSPDSININRVSDGLYVDINDGFTKLTGYTRADVIGKTSLELNIWAGPDDRQKLVDGIRTDGKIENLEATFIGKSGQHIVGLMSASLIELGGEPHTVNIVRDITALRAAERAARDDGQQAQRYLDVAATIMIALNDQGVITLVNKKGLEILGLPEEEIVGQNWFDRFIPESEREHIKRFFNQLLDGERIGLDYYENEVVCAGHATRLIAWYNTLLRDSQGRISGVISSGIDITERSRMERELRIAHERLELERDNLEKKNIALSEVLSRIEGEKEAVKQTMIGNIEENILPVIQKVKALGSPSQEALFEILEEDLRQITSEFTSGLKQRFHGLTPRQLQICRMIKNGHTSKEIAKSLGTSLLTIHKHREAIRDKLGIKNRGINLNSYLQSL